jgi:hypothetical protein
MWFELLSTLAFAENVGADGNNTELQLRPRKTLCYACLSRLNQRLVHQVRAVFCRGWVCGEVMQEALGASKSDQQVKFT